MKKIIILCVLCLSLANLSYAQKKQPINIISYNIRLNVASDGLNAWPNRKENVKALVKFYDADILCVQEALPDQFDDLLAKAGPM